MSDREAWPKEVSTSVLTKCHFACCVCPEHRRVADLHHIDGDHSNSVEDNCVALCKLCHVDAHSTSTMRRNLQPLHLRELKKQWEAKCSTLQTSLSMYGCAITNAYYLNVHRLDSLVREYGLPTLMADIPHRPEPREGSYDTLWSNSKNTLDWTRLGENRAYYENCFKVASRELKSVDLSLIELGAIDVNEHIGRLISFTCQFIGHDIPDQDELVANIGHIDGPPPTMRRQVENYHDDTVFEACMMLDMRYMYADSSFIQFSEAGIWNGIGRIVKYRHAIGSNDGHLLRNQLVISPICIGTPGNGDRISRIASGANDRDADYLSLYRDQHVDID